jgi:hypothetical protein
LERFHAIDVKPGKPFREPENTAMGFKIYLVRDFCKDFIPDGDSRWWPPAKITAFALA